MSAPPMSARILPVEVPWRTSTADSIAGFSGDEGNVVVKVVAYFGPHFVREEQAQIEALGRTPTDEEMNRLGFHEVTLTFPFVSTFRMMPPHGPGALVDEQGFDWSAFPLRDLWRTSYARFREEFAQRWEAEGLCPDPRFYEVTNSPLIGQLGLTASRHKHWMLLGHDAYFEIVGSTFQWARSE